MLSARARNILLKYACECLTGHLSGAARGAPPEDDDLKITAPVFVTLRSRGELRGCIGELRPTEPLGPCIGTTTVESATEDPRFPPVESAELKNLSLEISVLTDMLPAKPEDVVAGKHGVYVAGNGRKALLLPQVAKEWNVDAFQLLSMACRKAGLDQHAWRGPDVTIEIFEAEVFAVERLV